MFSKALIALAFISTTFAVPFITQPVGSTTFEAGKTGTVSWQDDGNKPSLSDYSVCTISIYVGNSQQQTRLQVLGSAVDVSKNNSLPFIADASIGPNGADYFIRVESNGFKDPKQTQYPAMAFSSKFTLSGMSGTFNQSVLDQIKGQSTAPLLGATVSSTLSGSSSSPTSSGFSTTTSSKKPSATSSSLPSATSHSAAEAVVFRSSWLGAVLAAFFGVAMM